MISYRTGNDLDLDLVLEVYRASTLGQRRPIEDRARMGRMLKEANLVISAWEDGHLVGIARCLTDWVYCTYLADLAVDSRCQRQGIGRELIRLTREAAPEAMLILLAAPAAERYYPRLGFTQHQSAWIMKPGEPLA